MRISLKGNIILIAGMYGTGKTYLAKFLVRNYKTFVYSPYPEEWKNEDVIFYQAKDFLNEFPFVCSIIKKLANQKKIDLALIDDADLLFKTHFDVSYETRDLVIGHRHYGDLGIILVTRRPQDLPARLYGLTNIMCLFTQESPQAIDLFNKMFENLGEMVKQIPFQSYEFLLKEIGKEPIKVKI